MSFSLSYVAGIIDGEGCISFSSCRNVVFPRVLVTNTNTELLFVLKQQFGGDIKPLSLRKPGWKQGYSWRISWSPAVELLKKLDWHLFVKRQQAATVFAWDEVRPGRGGKWDQDALDFLQQRMKWLNKKGPSSEPDPIEVVLSEMIGVSS